MALPLLLVFVLLCAVWLVKKTKTIPSSSNLSNYSYIISALQAFILSIFIGVSSWEIFHFFPQKYSDFVSGGLGFANQNKSAELNSIYISVFSFAILFILILCSYRLLPINKDFYNSTLKISIYGLTPSFLMLGQSIRTPNSKYLLLFASLLIVLSILINLTLVFLNKKNLINSTAAHNIGIKLMLIPLFLGLSEIGIKMLLTRTGFIPYKFGTLSVVLGLIYITVTIIGRRSNDTISRINLGLFLGQLGVPLLFFTLFTPSAKLTNGTTNIFAYKPALLVLIVGLLIISVIDISRRNKQGERQSNTIVQIISPWTLVAILVLIQSHPVQWPGIAADEYHWGEFYNPWWLLEKYQYIPFVDYQPARGLVNYIPGLLSWMFYDNTFASQSLVFNHFSALYVFVAFFAFRPVVGDFLAFLMVGSLAYFTGEPTGGLIITVASLAIMHKLISGKKYLRTFWAWVGLSFFSSLYYVAEGSMFVLGTLPLAIWLLFMSFHQSKKQLLISLGFFSLAAVISIWITNIELILAGVVRYLVEQAGINEVAHGTAWNIPPNDIAQAVTSGYFWQIARFSWLLLIVPTSIFLIRKQFNNQNRENLFTLIALFIISIVIIPRAAGRIDPVAFSRPGLTSIGLVICGLPLVILPNIRKSSLLPILPLIFAIIFGLLGNQEAQLRNTWIIPQQILQEPNDTVDGSALGLPTIGTGILIDQDQLKRHLEIKTVLEQILGPNETYFDATNHSADYGIQGRPSPVTDLAPYNVPSTDQQKRIVEQLDANNVPLALIQAENILHDGGTLSLRNFIIYEYLLNNYYPFMDEFGRIWMVRIGQENRLIGTNYRIGGKTEQINLLTQAFWQIDLASIPSSWGKSMGSLVGNLTDPHNLLSESQVIDHNGVALLDNGMWNILGSDSFLVFNLPQDLDGDLLYLEFSHEISDGYFQIYWADEHNSNFEEERSFKFSGSSDKYLVPVSAAPSWTKSDFVTKIRVAFPNGTSNDIQLVKVYLYSRK